MSDGILHTLSAERTAVPNTYDPNRRAGSGGQRYFSDIQYASAAQLPAVLASNAAQAVGLAALNAQNPARQARPSTPTPTPTPTPAPTPTPTTPKFTNAAVKGTLDTLIGQYGDDREGLYRAIAQQIKNSGVGIGEAAQQISKIYRPDNKDLSKGFTADEIAAKYKQLGFAQGGLASLPQSQGYYLGGATDGMADKIPANINGTQEAALSDGEFVIPADVVSHLGNGNSSAGAQVLHSMMDRIRKARTGKTEQGRQINPNKFAPA